MSLKYINRYKQVAGNFDMIFICDVQDKQINSFLNQIACCKHHRFMGEGSTLQKGEKKNSTRKEEQQQLNQSGKQENIILQNIMAGV